MNETAAAVKVMDSTEWMAADGNVLLNEQGFISACA